MMGTSQCATTQDTQVTSYVTNDMVLDTLIFSECVVNYGFIDRICGNGRNF